MQTGHARYSHAAMGLGYLTPKESMIEQLFSGVKIRPISKLEKGFAFSIWRNKVWSEQEKIWIASHMQQQMRQPYGFLKIPLNALDCIFRTYWFTQTLGISHFKECMQIIAWSAYKILGTDNVFGTGWRSVSPDIADDYCRTHPDEWEEIYSYDPAEIKI